MALVSATDAEYAAFRTKYGYSITTGEEALLPLAFTFLSSLPFCDGDAVTQTTQITEAQCFIAYAMSANGGGFNPAALGDSRTLTRKELGRDAIVKHWEVNEALIGTDSMSLLRSIPMALGLLDAYLCPVATDGSFAAGAYVV